mmetsp:Transcript_127/g.458  ORF Transcript_127/g.458 Transcript_127/m.458 type:complete len:173 (+) Transcript_127:954-1472(+)
MLPAHEAQPRQARLEAHAQGSLNNGCTHGPPAGGPQNDEKKENNVAAGRNNGLLFFYYEKHFRHAHTATATATPARPRDRLSLTTLYPTTLPPLFVSLLSSRPALPPHAKEKEHHHAAFWPFPLSSYIEGKKKFPPLFRLRALEPRSIRPPLERKKAPPLVVRTVLEEALTD